MDERVTKDDPQPIDVPATRDVSYGHIQSDHFFKNDVTTINQSAIKNTLWESNMANMASWKITDF